MRPRRTEKLGVGFFKGDAATVTVRKAREGEEPC